MPTLPAPITTRAGLEQAVERLRADDWFALDTEFIRETTYWPRLCLVQVANDDYLALIDPLALDDLDPLLELLHDPAVTKVLHAAGQDLEIFHRMSGRVPAPVFDTQVAAPLLGFPEQAGFGRLVETLLEVRLGKGHARTDWAARPLADEALAYAADDVRYLVPLYHAIRDGLAERGRLGWLDDELAHLVDPARYERPAADAWRRLRGVDRLPGPGRAVARALAEWREERARSEDVPRGHVLRDDALIDIARARPHDRGQLGRIRSLRGAAAQRHGDTLLALVAEARDRQPPASAGGTEATPVPDARGEALVDALSAIVRLEAVAHDLNPATIAERKALARIAAGEPVRTVLTGWRAAVVAESLEGFMAGERVLRHTGAGLDSDGRG